LQPVTIGRSSNNITIDVFLAFLDDHLKNTYLLDQLCRLLIRLSKENTTTGPADGDGEEGEGEGQQQSGTTGSDGGGDRG
jgi:hypothetical protein